MCRCDVFCVTGTYADAQSAATTHAISTESFRRGNILNLRCYFVTTELPHIIWDPFPEGSQLYGWRKQRYVFDLRTERLSYSLGRPCSLFGDTIFLTISDDDEDLRERTGII
jgi:hypothetical protein